MSLSKKEDVHEIIYYAMCRSYQCTRFGGR